MSVDTGKAAQRIEAAAAGAKGGNDKAREGVADMQALAREIAQERGALTAEAKALRAEHGDALAASEAWSFKGGSEAMAAAEASIEAQRSTAQGNKELAAEWTEKARGHEAEAKEAAMKAKEVLSTGGADQAKARLDQIDARVSEVDSLRDKAFVTEKTAAKELYEGERVEGADPDAYGRYQSAKSALVQADGDVKSLERELAKAENALEGAEEKGDPHIASKQGHASELRESLAEAKEARHQAKAQHAEAKIEYERVAEDNPSPVDPDPNAPPAAQEPLPNTAPAAQEPLPNGPVTLPAPLDAPADPPQDENGQPPSSQPDPAVPSTVEHAPGTQTAGGTVSWDSSSAAPATWESGTDANVTGNGSGPAPTETSPAASGNDSPGFDATGNETGAAH